MLSTFDTLSAIGPELTDEQLDEAAGGIHPVVFLVVWGGMLIWAGNQG